VITWPVGFVIVARNDRVPFVLTELFWAVLNVGLTFLLVRRFGLEGAGMAFFLSYLAHGIVVYLIVRRLTGFRWSSANLRTGALYLGVNAMAFSVVLLQQLKLAMGLALAAVLLTSLHALYALTRLVDLEQLPAVVQRAAARLSVGRRPLARRA
jgi:PST family polysaccharide transporter